MMGPGKPASECDNEELVNEFESACRGGDYEFSEGYRNELLRRLGVRSLVDESAAYGNDCRLGRCDP